LTLQWFKSYLANRQQCVTIHSELSTYATITCGVPQGSILGPLLFILYINDVVNSSKLLKFVMFADDTNVFYSHKNLSELIATANPELGKIINWLRINKLSLNIKKTLYCFSP